MDYSKRRWLLITVLAWGLFGLAFSIRNATSQSQPKSQEPDPAVLAMRRGGVREAARVKGHYVGSESTTGWMKYDIEALTSSSAAIVIGRPLTSSSRVTPSGDRIVTDFKIKIEREIKGTFGEERLINVVVPGGKVIFEDGSSAEIETPDLGPIDTKQDYIFFLNPSKEVNSYRLTGGGQGLFEISSSDRRVKPLGDKSDIVQKHQGKKSDELIQEIEAAAKKHPGTTPCCR